MLFKYIFLPVAHLHGFQGAFHVFITLKINLTSLFPRNFEPINFFCVKIYFKLKSCKII